MIGIGEMDSVVTLNTYTVSQNAVTGRVEKELSSSFERWAKVEQLSESRTLNNAGIIYTRSYRITTLYAVGQATKATATITLHSGEVLSIASVIKKDIGRLWVEEIIAYTNE